MISVWKNRKHLLITNIVNLTHGDLYIIRCGKPENRKNASGIEIAKYMNCNILIIKNNNYVQRTN